MMIHIVWVCISAGCFIVLWDSIAWQIKNKKKLNEPRTIRNSTTYSNVDVHKKILQLEEVVAFLTNVNKQLYRQLDFAHANTDALESEIETQNKFIEELKHEKARLVSPLQYEELKSQLESTKHLLKKFDSQRKIEKIRKSLKKDNKLSRQLHRFRLKTFPFKEEYH